nr:hypothetical protein CFP56_62147 [Quercus suber]
MCESSREQVKQEPEQEQEQNVLVIEVKVPIVFEIMPIGIGEKAIGIVGPVLHVGGEVVNGVVVTTTTERDEAAQRCRCSRT